MEVVRYHTDKGFVTCLKVAVGRKLIQIIPMDSSGIKIVKVPLAQERLMKPLELKGKPYPVKRAKKLLRASGRRFGITRSAKQALRG